METEETKPETPLDRMIKRAAELKLTIDAQEAELKTVKEDFEKLSDLILRHLELAELDSIRAHGFLFFKQNRTSVPVPKTLEDKKAFFAFLEEKGIFLDMVSIHSQTHNSLYKSLTDDALKTGN